LSVKIPWTEKQFYKPGDVVFYESPTNSELDGEYTIAYCKHFSLGWFYNLIGFNHDNDDDYDELVRQEELKKVFVKADFTLKEMIEKINDGNFIESTGSKK
jgi:hypothetical protein